MTRETEEEAGLVDPETPRPGESTSSGASILALVKGDFLAMWKEMLVANLAYGLLASAVILPLPGLALRLSLATSGRGVAADQDIALFLLSPVGLVALVVIAATVIATVGLQVSCLMTIGWGRVEGRRLGAAGTLNFVLRRAGKILRLSFRIFSSCLLLAAPFLLAIGGLGLFFLRDYDINYYLSAKPMEFKICASAALSLALALGLLLARRALQWVFALPILLFEGKAPAKALVESAKRTRGDRVEILKALVAWFIFWLVLGTSIMGLLGLVTGWLVPLFEHRLSLLALVVGGSLATASLLNLGLGFLQISTFSLLAARLFERFGEPKPDYASLRELLSKRSDLGFLDWLRVRLSMPRLVALLVGFAVIGIGIGLYSLRGVSTNDQVTIVAHRGASAVAPENTLTSVAQALEQGTDWVEIDVQETLDGEVVVVHDSDFMKIAGVDLRVWEASWEQLQEIDIGSRFAPEFADQRVARLSDVLEMCRGESGVIIELKYYGHDERLAQRVVEIVERTDMVESVKLMSLNSKQVQDVRQLRPDWTVGLLTARALGDLTTADADFLAVNTAIASSGFVRRAKRSGKSVMAWTVNSPAAMSAMISHGVTGLITDEPALARRVLEQRREMSSVQRLLIDLGFVLDSLDVETSSEEDA